MDNGYLKEERERQRIGQNELAYKVGMTGPYLSMIENNKRKPGSKFLKEICRILSIDYFDACRKSRVLPHELEDEFFNKTKEKVE